MKCEKCEKKIPLKKKNKSQPNPLFQWVGYGFTHFPMGLKVPTHTDIFLLGFESVIELRSNFSKSKRRERERERERLDFSS